ncbi:DUF4173 domain-containing protein [Nocardia tengchongensis]|uniref:DUF4153 domain-containing protein n=1 Tax=Nocardia tengchongensis TaxID=2055889 RepID=UPI003410714B
MPDTPTPPPDPAPDSASTPAPESPTPAERSAAPMPAAEPVMAAVSSAAVPGPASSASVPAAPPPPLVSAVATPAMAGGAPMGSGGPAPWPAAWPAYPTAVAPSGTTWLYQTARPQIPSRSARVPVPNGLLAATAAAGCAAAVLVPLDRPGIGWVLTGLAITGAVYAVDRAARHADWDEYEDDESDDCEEADSTGGQNLPARGGAARRGWLTQVPWDRVWWTGVALALLSVGAFRAAPWLFVLCLVGAALAGSLAVVRRSAHGLLFDVFAVPLSAANSTPWLQRAMSRARARVGSGTQRVWWSIGVAAALLLIMVPLLAGADAVFAGLVNGLLPSIDVPKVLRWGAVFVVAGLGVSGSLFLLAGPPPPADDDAPRRARRFSPLEWGIPVGALTVVFAAFVATQVAVLFGGDGYVQRTASLTYAEYARSGFWQLSIVSVLTLAVIGVVLRYAGQETSGERRLLRIAVAVVIALVLVIVASAVQRMWTYQQAYGFTVLRLLVEVFEGWIALVYLLLFASLVRLRRTWVPRAAVGAALATLLALAVLNPEGFVADRNIDRWQTGRPLDTKYLSTLSPDALPATGRLPDAQRAAIEDVIRDHLSDDSWQGWNYSRATASR